MTYQDAVSLAATARAMGFADVRIEPNAWGRRCVWYSSWTGKHCAESEDRRWRRRRLEYRGPRRVYIGTERK
jgi:hypothetical protein